MLAKTCAKALFAGTGKLGFAAAFAGIFLAVCVAGFSLDARGSIMRALGPGRAARSDFLVAGKRLPSFGDSRGAGNAFSPAEIAAVEALPGVESAYPVVSNACRVEVSVSFGLAAYRSEMFFESAPDSFLGELPSGWGDESFVPIVVPKDFVALYNVGFAPSRGLPSLGEGLLAKLPLSVTVSGAGGSATLEARVVGTTDRFASFLVPERVMRWMNDEIAREPGIVRRLVVASRDSGDPGLAKGLAGLGIEVTNGNALLSETASVATAVLSFAAALGGIVGLLALATVLLGAQVLLSRRADELSVLADLGWPPSRLCGMYATRAFALAGVASAAAWIVSSIAARAFDAMLSGFAPPARGGFPGPYAALIAAAATIAVGALTYLVTERELSRDRRVAPTAPGGGSGFIKRKRR